MKSIILITEKYPYGKGETFLENEIGILACNFDKVYIYSSLANSNEEIIREVPQNVYVYRANAHAISINQYPRCLVKKQVLEEIISKVRYPNIIKKIAACCFFYKTVEDCCGRIPDFVNSLKISINDSIIVYSYWLGTVGMTALKINQQLEECGYETKCVSRTHRFDLYAERAYLKYLPFQESMIESFDKIYPCSYQGTKYLKNKYIKYEKKIETAYLGVPDRCKNPILNGQSIFHIVSCSNVIEVKRVHRIAEALSEISGYRIQWTHFGDGELLDRVKEVTSNFSESITVDFRGRVANRQVYEYYNDNEIHLFINVSTSEGLPVSIMEAISFGIPIIATDVGGTSEIVENGINGFLLREDFKNSELCSLITRFLQMPKHEYEILRQGARDLYEKKFSATDNYMDFCKKLSKLGE